MSPPKGKKGAGRGAIPSGLSPNAESDIMTLRQVADYLHCAYSTACRLVRQGEIPGFKVGGGWRFMKSEIDRWIAKGAARK